MGSCRVEDRSFLCQSPHWLHAGAISEGRTSLPITTHGIRDNRSRRVGVMNSQTSERSSAPRTRLNHLSLTAAVPVILAALAFVAVVGAHRVALTHDGSAHSSLTPLGNVYVVDSTGDGDNDPLARGCRDVLTAHCTLRAAIQIANLHAGADDITFNIPTSDPGFGNGTWTINLGKALDPISDDVNITG